MPGSPGYGLHQGRDASLQVAKPEHTIETRLDLVQAELAGHHDQPSALVLDLTALRRHQARERVLHDVFGRADVPQHPECEINEVRAVVLVGLADLPAVLFTVHAGCSGGPPRAGGPRAA